MCTKNKSCNFHTFPSEGKKLDDKIVNKTLGRAQDPRANGAWLSKLTE